MKLVQMCNSSKIIGLFHCCISYEHSGGDDSSLVESHLSVRHSGELFNGTVMALQRRPRGLS